MTHWKKVINHDYINEGDLDSGTIIATIKEIKLQEITSAGGKKDEKHVLHFVETNVKPLILSAKENFKSLEKVAGSPHIENWIGVKIEIWYNPNVKFGRETVGGVRIKPTAPVIQKPTAPVIQKPAIPESMWNAAQEKMKSGTTSVEAIEKNYTLTPEQKQILNSLKSK
jgi:hypothetical protein